MIKNIIFDLSEVIISGYYGVEKVVGKNSKYSEDQYFSYQYNKLKTDDGTFDIIINDLNIKPEETIFIDDAERNVEKGDGENFSQMKNFLHPLFSFFLRPLFSLF